MWKWRLMVLLTPTCWIQVSGRFDEKYDAWLNDCIDKGVEFKLKSKCRADILGVDVWIENHPYGSFTSEHFGVEVRPRRATQLRAHNHMMGCIHWP